MPKICVHIRALYSEFASETSKSQTAPTKINPIPKTPKNTTEVAVLNEMSPSPTAINKIGSNIQTEKSINTSFKNRTTSAHPHTTNFATAPIAKRNDGRGKR